ncbi:MAG: TIGR04282 family arsenosugar biosynthesis glycosyltransferase [Saprospiraceae bacterium]
MLKSNALVIFVKNARRGHVKTRLASSLGEDKALAIYLALCERVRNVCLGFSGKCYVYYSEYIPSEPDLWEDDFFIKRKQDPVIDLGLRMKAACNELLPVHSSVILIGTDIPHLTTNILEESILLLENTDVVLGPSDDGGYYLIGMKKTNDYLFQNMTWSIDTVLSESIQRINMNKMTYNLLKTLSDIDTADDWEKHGWF